MPLPLERMIGQRLMVGFDGLTLTDDVRYLIDTLHVGGLILFRRNIEAPGQLTALCAGAQAYARQCGQPPLFISIDQEGGQVARLPAPFTRFPGNPAMADTAAAAAFAAVTAGELAGAGVNMNLAPVLDVVPPGCDGVMAKRAFRGDAGQVATMGTAVIDGFQARGIMAVAKHFPGIGRTVLDSHLDLPTLDTDKAVLDRTDVVPFRAAIAAGVAGVMLSHVRYPAVDACWPASLSPGVCAGWLRKALGYEGVVMTDDLDMGAIDKHVAFSTAVGQAMAADVDILLICHRSPRMEAAVEEMTARCENSQAMLEKLQRSADRILRLKQQYLAHVLTV